MKELNPYTSADIQWGDPFAKYRDGRKIGQWVKGDDGTWLVRVNINSRVPNNNALPEPGEEIIVERKNGDDKSVIVLERVYPGEAEGKGEEYRGSDTIYSWWTFEEVPDIPENTQHITSMETPNSQYYTIRIDPNSNEIVILSIFLEWGETYGLIPNGFMNSLAKNGISTDEQGETVLRIDGSTFSQIVELANIFLQYGKQHFEELIKGLSLTSMMVSAAAQMGVDVSNADQASVPEFKIVLVEVIQEIAKLLPKIAETSPEPSSGSGIEEAFNAPAVEHPLGPNEGFGDNNIKETKHITSMEALPMPEPGEEVAGYADLNPYTDTDEDNHFGTGFGEQMQRIYEALVNAGLSPEEAKAKVEEILEEANRAIADAPTLPPEGSGGNPLENPIFSSRTAFDMNSMEDMEYLNEILEKMKADGKSEEQIAAAFDEALRRHRDNEVAKGERNRDVFGNVSLDRQTMPHGHLGWY